jgi:hypothetical protein
MNGTLDWLKKHWFIVVAVVTMASAWGQMKFQVSAHENDIAKLEQKQGEVSEIKGEVGVIKGEVKGIREDIRIIKEHLIRGDG